MLFQQLVLMAAEVQGALFPKRNAAACFVGVGGGKIFENALDGLTQWFERIAGAEYGISSYLPPAEINCLRIFVPTGFAQRFSLTD